MSDSVRRTLWQYSHSFAILFAVLLFTAGFLCTLLWTNGLVNTPSSVNQVTFTKFSPAVSTFSISYQVAIFGTAWNAILFVALLVLERYELPIPTTRLRYEVEKAACIVAVVGNAIYSVACIALMATLARLAAIASSDCPGCTPQEQLVADSAGARRAGQGSTAAFAGLAAAAAVWACVMDWLHMKDSDFRRVIEDESMSPDGPRTDAGRQA